MYKFLTKNGQMVAFGLGVVITILFLAMVLSGVEAFNAMPDDAKGTTSIFNLGLFAAIGLVILGFLAMLIFGVLHVVSDLKGSVKGLIGLAAMVVIFLVARTIGSDDSAISQAINDFNITPGQSSIISGAIVTALVMAALAAAAFVLSEIRNFFK